MSIGTKIYELRTAKNLSQGDLADILDVSRQSVSKWETDTSTPDLDKLIKMCDLFDVTLDELTCREPKALPHSKTDAFEKEHPLTQQKIIGYILLSVSLLASILVWIFAESESDLDMPIPIIFTALACSLICLFVKQKAGYWCVWAIAAPIVVLSPHFVGFPILTTMNTLLVIFSIIMVFVANRIFDKPMIPTDKIKKAHIILAWCVLIVLRVIEYIIIMQITISSALAMLPFIIMDLTAYIYTALLVTNTVCYVKNTKRNK
ncbi:MAG: helix-turn-helix transcriptional regulator [Clostridia bacterium]|nr:helix-turn-helix transcriptional regulator [Clostridia bacterium]